MRKLLIFLAFLFLAACTDADGSLPTGSSLDMAADTSHLRDEVKERPDPAPEIVVTPPEVEFGWVEVGQAAEATVAIFNMGALDLQVTSVSLSPDAHEDLSLEESTDAVFALATGGKHEVTIRWAPQSLAGMGSDPIGALLVQSDDPDEALVEIPIHGGIAAPSIKLTPAAELDFGNVAQEWEIPRTLTIENLGHASLTIHSLEIVENSALGEFAITADGDFPPSDGSGDGFILGDEEDQKNSVDVELTFTNMGGSEGDETGVLKLVSDDPILPEIFIDMVARRGGDPTCAISFAPSKLHFGNVPHGGEKTMEITVVNSGSGYCSMMSGKIIECTSFMGMIGACFDTAGPSPHFNPQGFPIPARDGLSPGAEQPIQILFKPPTSIPWIPTLETYAGAFQVTYAEPYSVPGEYAEHTFPKADPAGQIPWNMYGESGVAAIEVFPGEVDFGLVTVGCLSQTITLKIYGAGTASSNVADLSMDDCGPEFLLVSYPALPAQVQAGQFIEVEVAYLPSEQGAKTCDLIVLSNTPDTPLLPVSMKGEGTYEAEQIDDFTQIEGLAVDLLFVIDDSASMCGEHDKLAANIGDLTQAAEQWQYGFQAGIITTNIVNTESAGKLLGEPRILTSQSIELFGTHVAAVGCAGAGSQESGLEAARRALSPPLTFDTEIPCDCPDDDPCQETCSEGHTCVSGACGGYNRGFLRKDAALEVIFVSDEDDQSPGAVPFYIDFFKSIKGAMNEDLFHAHAIVGDSNGGCSTSQDEDADAGARYIDVQEATGGIFHSICDEDFGSAMKDIGDIAFGPQVQFFLSAQADSTGVQVWVDSGSGYQECMSGWDYHPDSNSVIFDQNGPCMPQSGDEIQVHYQMACNAI
ncbi:MAG: choice-of-anchor D domain-containing protein [Pseudomonadota bacterium]